jgi:hypothetical protein
MKQTKAIHWHNAKTELPDEMVRVLAIDTRGEVFVATYRDGWLDTIAGAMHNVTHWTELPETPKVEEE